MTISVAPGQLYLIDTSAHARSQHAAVRNLIAGLIADRAAATCVTVDLEAAYSGRDHADVRLIAQRRKELYVVLPISEMMADRARDVQVRMAARGHHRAAGVIDLLTAAVAEHMARSSFTTTRTSSTSQPRPASRTPGLCPGALCRDHMA